MAKHNKSLCLRRKRMKRTQRLQAAEKFFRVYNGKNIVRGYSRYFGVSLLCAALELKMLGCNISDELIERYRLEEQRKAEARRRKRNGQKSSFGNTITMPLSQATPLGASPTASPGKNGNSWRNKLSKRKQRYQKRKKLYMKSCLKKMRYPFEQNFFNGS